MSGIDIAFYVFAALAVISAWRVFRTDSMVRAAFLLLMSFMAVGVIMLLLGAVYLGVALLFMMAVEMMVMALFMLMFMMNPAGLNPMNMVHQPRIAFAAGAIVSAVLVGVAALTRFPRAALQVPTDPVQTLGTELLGDSMLVFESAGVMLLATMIGVVVLSGSRGRFGRSDVGSVPPGLTPGGAPAGNAEPEQGQGGQHGH